MNISLLLFGRESVDTIGPDRNISVISRQAKVPSHPSRNQLLEASTDSLPQRVNLSFAHTKTHKESFQGIP